MKTSSLTVGLFLGLIGALILGLGLLTPATTARAEAPWTVKLSDGEILEGKLIRIEAGRYILQADGQLFELSDDDIDPQTFAARPRKDTIPEQPVIEARHYDELFADGTISRHWEMNISNDTSRAITELRFGLAPWERAYADQREYRDPFGNQLVPVYEPSPEKWGDIGERRVQVSLALAVPVAPGELMTINGAEVTPWIVREGEGFRYRSVGDFAEDRLIWRKVRLPRGAQVEEVTPEPVSRFTQDGYEYLMWRQYYRKGEVKPLEVLYRLD